MRLLLHCAALATVCKQFSALVTGVVSVFVHSAAIQALSERPYVDLVRKAIGLAPVRKLLLLPSLNIL